jgi:malonyl-CoA O-methyltransferase
MIHHNHPLMHAVQEEILSRLNLVALKPKRILALACDDLRVRYPDAEIIATADTEDSIDLIVSNLYLPWCADVEALFREWRRLLRPEGLLMLTSLGPATLSEIDLEPLPQFMDMHNVGDALLKAGFADPVLDVEHFEMKYQDKTQLLSDLEKMGITEVNTSTLSLSYEVVYGHAWCPAKQDDFLADSDGMVKIPLAALRARLR